MDKSKWFDLEKNRIMNNISKYLLSLAQNNVVWTSVIFGFLSGISEAVVFIKPEGWFGPVSPFPGLVFGLVTAIGLYCMLRGKTRYLLLNLLAWIVISTLSFYLAIIATNGVPSMFFVGAIGAFVLCVGFFLIFTHFHFGYFALALLSGGLVAYCFFLNFHGEEIFSLYPLILLFTLWQTAVMTVFGFALSSGIKKIREKYTRISPNNSENVE